MAGKYLSGKIPCPTSITVTDGGTGTGQTGSFNGEVTTNCVYGYDTAVQPSRLFVIDGVTYGPYDPTSYPASIALVGGATTGITLTLGGDVLDPTLSTTGLSQDLIVASTLSATDLCGETATTTASLTLSAPTADATDDSYVGVVGQPLNGIVATNDVACDQGAVTTYQITAGSESNGSTNATLDATTGAFTWTPDAGYVGLGGFMYDILCDGSVVDSATVVIETISADAVDDSFTDGIQDSPYSGSVTGNDVVCPAPFVTTYETASSETNGVLTSIDANSGAFVFTPTAGFSGQGSFQYNILCDGSIVDTATVLIDFAAITADAVDDTFTDGVENQPYSATAAANDTVCTSGVTSYALVAASATNGTVTSFDTTTSDFTFAPSANFVGTGTFQYEILCDGTALDTATVSITFADVTADAVDDSFTDGIADTVYSGTVATNDVVCDNGAASTYNGPVAASETNGTVTSFDSATGDFEFTPTAGFVGQASFQYEILCDGFAQDTATVLIDFCPATYPLPSDTITDPVTGSDNGDGTQDVTIVIP